MEPMSCENPDSDIPLWKRALVARTLPPKRLPRAKPPPRWTPPVVQELQQSVADYFGFTLEQLLGKRRTKNLALARQLALLLTRERYGLSYPELGAAFNRDHTTAMHGVKAMQRRLVPGYWLWDAVKQLMPPGPRQGE